MNLKVAPHAFEIADGDTEAIRMNRDGGCIHGTRRRPGDDREWINRTRRHEIGDRPQHTDLISRTRTAPRQHEPDLRRCSSYLIDRLVCQSDA